MIPCQMENDINQIKTEVSSIKTDIGKIKDALLGDEYREDGLIASVDAHQRYIDNDKKMKWIVYGGVAVLVFLMEVVPAIISLFKKS